MHQNIFYVVGEKFKNFSKNKNIMTISELDTLSNIYRIGLQPKYTFVVGQGVGADKLEESINKINKNGLVNYFSIKRCDVLDIKANQQFVHKEKLDNVMITIPEIFAKSTYISQLTLQDNCAEISDHMTGQHVQGMVLIEAARQMMLSVSEKYIIDESKKGHYYFVLNNINTDFHRFTFPLQVSVLCEVADLVITRKGAIKSRMKFSFIQNNIRVTDVEIQFTAYEKSFIEEREQLLVENAIAASLKIDTKLYAAEVKVPENPSKRQMYI